MKLRGLLRSVVSELMNNGCYTHDDVIRTMRDRYPNQIFDHLRVLEDMALRKMLSDIKITQLENLDTDQFELPLGLADGSGSFDAFAVGASNKPGERIGFNSMTVKMIRAASTNIHRKFLKPSRSEILENFLRKLTPCIKSEDELFTEVIKRSQGGS